MNDKEKIEVLTKALKFYADSRSLDDETGAHYILEENYVPGEVSDFEIAYDQGQRAQDALCKVYGHTQEYDKHGYANYPETITEDRPHCFRCGAWLDL